MSRAVSRPIATDTLGEFRENYRGKKCSRIASLNSVVCGTTRLVLFSLQCTFSSYNSSLSFHERTWTRGHAPSSEWVFHIPWDRFTDCVSLLTIFSYRNRKQSRKARGKFQNYFRTWISKNSQAGVLNPRSSAWETIDQTARPPWLFSTYN